MAMFCVVFGLTLTCDLFSTKVVKLCTPPPDKDVLQNLRPVKIIFSRSKLLNDPNIKAAGLCVKHQINIKSIVCV